MSLPRRLQCCRSCTAASGQHLANCAVKVDVNVHELKYGRSGPVGARRSGAHAAACHAVQHLRCSSLLCCGAGGQRSPGLPHAVGACGSGTRPVIQLSLLSTMPVAHANTASPGISAGLNLQPSEADYACVHQFATPSVIAEGHPPWQLVVLHAICSYYHVFVQTCYNDVMLMKQVECRNRGLRCTDGACTSTATQHWQPTSS